MRKNKIHKSALVSSKAIIGNNVEIGPYCIIGDNVTIGDNNTLISHVVIDGRTSIGNGNTIYPFVAIGLAPQDLKYSGEDSSVIIGNNNNIRENVTIHRGTNSGGMVTKIGNNCLFMANSHVAHDCTIGNNVIVANSTAIAGHVMVGDFAIIGGLCGIHQFVRIGHHAMIGGMSGIDSDIIPYGQANGERASLMGLNLVGLKRRQFSKEKISILRSAYRLIFSPEGTLNERIEDAKKMFSEHNEVAEIVDFIKNSESRSICQPKNQSVNNDNEQ